MKTHQSAAMFLPALLVVAAGCQSAYYSAMEKMGVHKRDIMVSRVEAARDSQNEAKNQFVSALETFKSVVQFKGGDLEKEYDRLHGALRKSEARADEVRSRIQAVENVSKALFKEWSSEIRQYSNKELKRSSQEKYDLTLKKYKSLIAAMKKAESRIEPALTPLRDQVLYLKHNLNAKAIAGLGDELLTVQSTVDQLVKDMESSVNEANAFIASLQPAETR